MTSPRWRPITLLAGLLFAALAFLSWSQTWYLVTLTGQSASHAQLSVGGAVAAPAVAAFALACVAGFAAISIAGVVFRFLIAVLELVLGVSIVLSAILAIVSPLAAVESAVTQATSIAGSGPVAALVGSNVATTWPFIALGAGILVALSAVGIMITARSWPHGGRRYQTFTFDDAAPHTKPSRDSAISDWDELSDGSDPTSR